MVFEEHFLFIEHAKDFNFACFVRHRIAQAFAEAVALRLRLIHNFNAFHKWHLKLGFHMGNRPALENIIGDHTIANQGVEQIGKRIRIVVDAAE